MREEDQGTGEAWPGRTLRLALRDEHDHPAGDSTDAAQCHVRGRAGRTDANKCACPHQEGAADNRSTAAQLGCRGKIHNRRDPDTNAKVTRQRRARRWRWVGGENRSARDALELTADPI